MVSINPAVTGQGRTFINTEGPGCGNSYTYLGCYKIDSLEKSFGEITSIYCPSESIYDAFVEVASIKGADSRGTSTITGILTVDNETELEKISRRGCSFNLQVHFGTCNRPDDFDSFNSAIILQDVRLTNYSLSSLTALSPDERAAVSETASISVGSTYRVFDIDASIVAATLTADSGLLGIAICDNLRCGTNCNDIGTSDGCQRIYAINGEGNLVFSINGGVVWEERPINNIVAPDLTSIQDHHLTCVGDEIWFVTDDGTNSRIYVIETGTEETTINFFDARLVYTSPDDQTLRFLTLGADLVYAVGDGTNGTLVVVIDKVTKTASVIDEGGIAVTGSGIQLMSVDALNDNVVLIGSAGGQVIFSSIQGSFEIIDVVVNGNDIGDLITDVHMINDTDWLVSGQSGIYCTGDRGNTWQQVLLENETEGGGHFSFYDDIVGYYYSSGNLYRTIDSGNNWTLVESFVNDDITRGVSVCPTNPNVVYAAGGTANVASGNIIRGVL